jgi:hypothetical protein
MVGLPTKGQAMTEPQIFDYSVYIGVMDNGQEILVQIFTDPNSGKYLQGQIAFRSHASSWGVPIPLEKR